MNFEGQMDRDNLYLTMSIDSTLSDRLLFVCFDWRTNKIDGTGLW